MQAEGPVLALLFVVALVAAPALLIGAAAWASAAASGLPVRRQLGAFVYALVPVGAGVWAAHYGFHLLTGVFTAVPVLQSAVIDATGRAWLGGPYWTWVGLQPGAVFAIQLGLIALGAMGSVAVARLVAERESPVPSRRRGGTVGRARDRAGGARRVDAGAADGHAGGGCVRMMPHRASAVRVAGRAVLATVATLALAAPAVAHSGPPYPVVSNQVAGPYRLSVWTDPDATDDGSAGGQFWVTIEPARAGAAAARHARPRRDSIGRRGGRLGGTGRGAGRRRCLASVRGAGHGSRGPVRRASRRHGRVGQGRG